MKVLVWFNNLEVQWEWQRAALVARQLSFLQRSNGLRYAVLSSLTFHDGVPHEEFWDPLGNTTVPHKFYMGAPHRHLPSAVGS